MHLAVFALNLVGFGLAMPSQRIWRLQFMHDTAVAPDRVDPDGDCAEVSDFGDNPKETSISDSGGASPAPSIPHLCVRSGLLQQPSQFVLVDHRLSVGR
jgi:hypothetical protein